MVLKDTIVTVTAGTGTSERGHGEKEDGGLDSEIHSYFLLVTTSMHYFVMKETKQQQH